MAKHAHRFVEDYDGFIGFGLDRESDANTLIYYLQKISDDALAQALIPRLTEAEQQDLFDMLTRLLKTHLSEGEYHRLFLKDR
ncbi:MAG TPA: cytoplasmic protein [Desulfosarcina sp.]|nr:cytoplasmic protein [Desulfosarcina sp.]